jgi:cytochrome c oxidase subunit I+III
MISSIGAFILAAGFLVFLWDVVRPKGRQSLSARNPWNAGTLEWLAEMPDRPWGVRSIPEIDSRYPMWDQPNFVRDVDEGRFFLPDAEEGLRETLVTTSIDARPIQCLRVPGPTFLTLWAAIFTGGVFIFSTYHWWMAASLSGVLALGTILVWLWTGTAWIPEKEEKVVGRFVLKSTRGQDPVDLEIDRTTTLTLPIYVSGPDAVGWWAMFITMLGDMTAFVSLVFGYFFYWTIHEDFPPRDASGPGLLWPITGGALLLGAWVLTLLARRWNKHDHANRFYMAILLAVALSITGAAALCFAPWTTGLDPTSHVYPATVWILVGWTAVHVAIGVIMHLYCAARRLAGRMTYRYDADIVNVALYWHFLALTIFITVVVIAGFPLVA